MLPFNDDEIKTLTNALDDSFENEQTIIFLDEDNKEEIKMANRNNTNNMYNYVEKTIPREHRERIIGLEVINIRFSEILSNHLSILFQLPITINPISIDLTYLKNEFRATPSPSLIQSMQTSMSDLDFYIIFNDNISFNFVSYALGGTKPIVSPQYKNITKIERYIVDDVLGVVSNSLEEAIANTITDFAIRGSNVEEHPMLVKQVHNNEEYFVITFNCDIDDASTSFRLLIPYEGLSKYFSILRELVANGFCVYTSSLDNVLNLARCRQEKQEKTAELIVAANNNAREYFKYLNKVDAYKFMFCMRNELTQTKACVLSFLTPESVKRFLDVYPEEERQEIESCMANLTRIAQPYLLEQVDNALATTIFIRDVKPLNKNIITEHVFDNSPHKDIDDKYKEWRESITPSFDD